MRTGTVTVRRPRVRDLDERFKSRLLPLFTWRTREVRDLLPDLYLHGLASGDFELALRGLLGEQAALASGYRESTASWSALLRDLKARGMNQPRLVIGDGALGLWSALRNIFPGAEEQRCWNHRVVNVLTQVPKQRQGEARELLTKIPYQASERQAQQNKRVFQNWCLEHSYERAAERSPRSRTWVAIPHPAAQPKAHERRAGAGRLRGLEVGVILDPDHGAAHHPRRGNAAGHPEHQDDLRHVGSGDRHDGEQ